MEEVERGNGDEIEQGREEEGQNVRTVVARVHRNASLTWLKQDLRCTQCPRPAGLHAQCEKKEYRRGLLAGAIFLALRGQKYACIVAISCKGPPKRSTSNGRAGSRC